MRRRQSCRAPSAVCAWSTTPRPRGSHAGVDAAGTGQLQRHLRDADAVEEGRGTGRHRRDHPREDGRPPGDALHRRGDHQPRERAQGPCRVEQRREGGAEFRRAQSGRSEKAASPGCSAGARPRSVLRSAVNRWIHSATASAGSSAALRCGPASAAVSIPFCTAALTRLTPCGMCRYSVPPPPVGQVGDLLRRSVHAGGGEEGLRGVDQGVDVAQRVAGTTTGRARPWRATGGTALSGVP
jgi:hypothetical protein